MKRSTQILVMLLTLLLPLALATQSAAGQPHQLRLNQTAIATGNGTPQPAETPIEVLEQVANLFSEERGLAISDSASIFLLCNQTNPLDDPDYESDTLGNLGVGLKIKF
ncbi:hypothetical protein [Trichloromonas sp.]|uniref:hypothetical protein n=1 Tax=Trichloromonas sp. TaxID=3069249 RepID=UPI003D81AE06